MLLLQQMANVINHKKMFLGSINDTIKHMSFNLINEELKLTANYCRPLDRLPVCHHKSQIRQLSAD